jgi:hypothetical protein
MRRFVDGWNGFRVYGEERNSSPALPRAWKTRSEFSPAGDLLYGQRRCYEMIDREKSRMPRITQYLCPMSSRTFGVDMAPFIKTEHLAAGQTPSIFLNFFRIFG